MEQPQVSYKVIDSSCNVQVRELNRHKAARRIIANNRRKRASAGLILSCTDLFGAGALVEIDLKFPGQEQLYRSRGVVDWVEQGASPEESKMGVLIFGIDKLDPSAPSPSMPAPSPAHMPTQAAPAPKIEEPKEAPVEKSPQSEPDKEQESAVEEEPEAKAEREKSSSDPAKGPEDETESAEDVEEEAPGLVMPETEDIEELFSGLIDGDVTIEVLKQEISAKRMAVIGDYLTDEDDLSCLMVADLKLVNRLGAALVMVPEEEAESSIQNKRITDEIQESFQEIFNISASLLNNMKGNPHLRFNELHVPSQGAEVPEAITRILENPTARVDMEVTVPGYGTGRMAILDGSTRTQES